MALQELETFYSGEYEDKFLIRLGDILIGMDGDFTIVKWRVRPALLNQRICKVEGKEVTDSGFLFYYFVDEITKIHAVTGATTVKHLSVKDIKAIDALLPPLPEQKKIATILTSVDEAIEKQKAQIAKLHDLKKAMMQELLTKGIGHTEFKDSPVGRIPKGWDAKRLGSVSKFSQGVQVGVEKHMSLPRKNSVRFLRISDYTKDNELPRYVDKSLAVKGVVSRDDVVMIRYGEAGRTCRGLEGAIANNLFTITPADNMTKGYLYLSLNSSSISEEIYSLAASSAMPAINFTALSRIQIVIPPLQEQQNITKILYGVDTNIEAKQKKLGHAKSLKKALMQDLLTGKVRVKI